MVYGRLGAGRFDVCWVRVAVGLVPLAGSEFALDCRPYVCVCLVRFVCVCQVWYFDVL